MAGPDPTLSGHRSLGTKERPADLVGGSESQPALSTALQDRTQERGRRVEPSGTQNIHTHSHTTSGRNEGSIRGAFLFGCVCIEVKASIFIFFPFILLSILIGINKLTSYPRVRIKIPQGPASRSAENMNVFSAACRAVVSPQAGGLLPS